MVECRVEIKLEQPTLEFIEKDKIIFMARLKTEH